MNSTSSPAAPTDAQSTLYQELIVEHKRAPRHFGKLGDPTHEARGHNPQCGDDLKVQLRIEGGRIGDIRFDGHGCAICIASASMMTEAVIGRDIEAARQLQQRFRAVLTGQAEHDEAYLGKLASFVAVQRYPSRIKCALLGWHALAHALGTPAAASFDQESHTS
ncbi:MULTISPECIES: Fe-S cluster assembly sulfur transfer protein SufU [Burkholderia]|uniref:Iron-sulfur cluster assembly scaffold protein n=1 Tax=Burkholderia mayonis TaxID=1385591 RepID=A0A1B4FCU5_9BURK|nr:MULTISPECIES: SUF system NifU family Fe-S cluster assembly protein [Burkholderia]AOJ01412.1 iron-sulfur cluster assembly scaffold protein [Burkholderia mayonis]KVE34800.1 iron-sulfur cluster assembly scaffold protein [Burkholderia sp. BDU5]KVE49101.1 iron-sulfur cluster assembly scaffold protein [Burkholderia mayonis]